MLRCGFDYDADQFLVRDRDSDSLLMPGGGNLYFTACDVGEQVLRRLPDDKTFLLHRLPGSSCLLLPPPAIPDPDSPAGPTSKPRACRACAARPNGRRASGRRPTTGGSPALPKYSEQIQAHGLKSHALQMSASPQFRDFGPVHYCSITVINRAFSPTSSDREITLARSCKVAIE